MEPIKLELTEQEIKNLLILIAKAQITGNDALTVAQLQIKLSNLLPKEEKVEEKK